MLRKLIIWSCLMYRMQDEITTEREEEFKNLGETLTNQNSIHEEIEGILNTGNTCYHSVQLLLSSVCYPNI